MTESDNAITATDGLRFAVDWASRLARYDMIWGEPHGMPSDWRCGAPLGNGDMGAMVYGSPDNLSFALGKNGLWDRHHEGRSTFKGGSFAQIVRTYRDRDLESFRRLCAEPEPREKQHATTAGMFRLHLHDADTASSTTLRLSLHNGVARLTFTPNGIEPRLVHWGQTEATMFISRAYGVLVIRVRPTTTTLDPVRQWCPRGELAPLGCVTWELSRAPHAPHPPATIVVSDRTALLRQLLLPDDQYVIACRMTGGAFSAYSAGHRVVGDLEVHACDPLTVYLSIVAGDEHDDPRNAAVARLDRAEQAGFDAILAEHTRWWNEYWNRGYAVCDDPAIERTYFTSLYHCGSILDPNAHSPGLQGPWIRENVPAWLGDFHSNVNIQSTYWGMLANNRLEMMRPLVRCVQRMAMQARRDTSQYFGLPGLRLPHAGSIDGFELTYGDWATNLGASIGGSAWLTQLIWQMYEYGQDASFLRDTAWPLLRDVAVFYEHYLRRDAETDRYVLEPSVFFESHCPRFDCWGRNSLYELSLVYVALRNATRAAEIVATAQATQLAGRWREVLARLPDLPTDPATNSWISFEGRDARDERTHFYSLAPVFPAELVSRWHGPTEWRERAVNSLNHPLTANGCTGKAWCGGQGIRELIRLGLVDQAFAALRSGGLHFDARNINGLGHSWDAHYLQADHAPGMCSVLPDMLVLSIDGCIRLLPCWPEGVPVAFHSLRVPGAFLVSAEQRGKEIDYAIIQSLAGLTLRLANPWSGHQVIARDLDDDRLLVAGTHDILELETAADQRVVLHRAGIDRRSIPMRAWA